MAMLYGHCTTVEGFLIGIKRINNLTMK